MDSVLRSRPVEVMTGERPALLMGLGAQQLSFLEKVEMKDSEHKAWKGP